MPEKTLKKINSCILQQWKVCFFSAFFVGLLAHLYKITGWLPNWDSLVFRYDPQNMIGLGRWFLPVVCSFSAFYDLPFLNGIVAIVFHGLGAVCICEVLNVRRKITAFLLGAVTATFPAVTSVMMYNYVADGYAVAFFLSAFAALLLTKEKPKYIVAALLITLSAGIYQAYITVTITLILFKLIDEIIFGDTTVAVTLKKSGLMLLTGISGMAIYGIILKLLLAVFSVEMLDYQGLSSSVEMSAINIPASLYLIKETFVKFFFDVSEGISLYVVLNAFVCVFAIVFYGKYIVRNKVYKKPEKLTLLVFLCPVMILGATVLAFINSAVEYHNLVLMGYCVFYIIFLVIYEKGEEKPIKSWIVLLTTLVLVANQVVIANVSYHKAQMAYEKSYGVLVRIADRMEQTYGVEKCEKILVLGALEDSRSYSVNLPPEITGITDGFIIRFDDETVGQSVFTSALNEYCGKNYDFLSGEEKRKLAHTEEVKNMEAWPGKNCIKVIGDTVVVKLGTEGEN